MSSPRVPAPANEPMLILSSYPRFLSSGKEILPMVAVVADDEPLTAAKMPQANTLMCTNPPGKERTQGPRPSNISWASLVRYRISPIQIKSGKAVSAQLVEDSQLLAAKIKPAGVSAKNTNPIIAQAIKANPIHTPSPKSNNKLPINTTA